MTEEQPENHNILEALKGTNYVVAETFLIRNGSSNETATEEVRIRLSNQGITDHPAVTFCNSKEERIKEMVNSLKRQKALNAGNDPWMTIVGFDANQLQEMFEVISAMIIGKDPIMEGIDAKNITLLQLNALYPVGPTVDNRTGITIAAIRKGEPAFPMHPTPAH